MSAMNQTRLHQPPDEGRRPALAHGGRGALVASRLRKSDQREVLDFLAVRPLNTVIMSGLIRDNGLESPCNRGSFYGCRDGRGELIGVALVGHVTLFEARHGGALSALARASRRARGVHAVVGEREGVRVFCSLRADSDFGRPPLSARREQFMVLTKSPAAAGEPPPGLAPATLEHLAAIVEASAEMAEEATGVNPHVVAPEGFRRRAAGRVERGRVWAWFEGGRLVFKVEVAAETPEAVYLEGLYVNPQERGRGHARRCLSSLCDILLRRAGSVCLMVEEGNSTAQALYGRLGFEPHCTYDRVCLPHA